jgi:hypothetical protein
VTRAELADGRIDDGAKRTTRRDFAATRSDSQAWVLPNAVPRGAGEHRCARCCTAPALDATWQARFRLSQAALLSGVWRPIIRTGSRAPGTGIADLVLNTHHRAEPFGKILGDGARAAFTSSTATSRSSWGTGGVLWAPRAALDPDGCDEPFPRQWQADLDPTSPRSGGGTAASVTFSG